MHSYNILTPLVNVKRVILKDRNDIELELCVCRTFDVDDSVDSRMSQMYSLNTRQIMVTHATKALKKYL